MKKVCTFFLVSTVIGMFYLGMAVLCFAADDKPLDSPVALESLARPGLPAQMTFDANTGTYTRKVKVMEPIWSSKGPQAVSGVDPFKAKGSATPSYNAKTGDVGEGMGGSFIGGDMTEWKDAVRRGPIILCIFGGLMLAAGIVVAVWAQKVLLGLSIAGAGMALIITGILFEAYPWIAIVAIVVLLAAGIWWLVDTRAGTKASTSLTKVETALTAVVRGVEAAPAAAQAAVKKGITTAATTTGKKDEVKTTITKAKTKAGV